ncbi:MAG: NAD-dependent epimerase/dehydratase family protein [Cyclobacteriaceae bacterium]|nr:NAD-dependent epimerase/dehydratase family protein [Cyclobacteriaceae bacterium]
MIAITGANGLLGSYILRKLVAEKVPVIALCRNNSDRKLVTDIKDITWRNADVTDPVSLEDALQGATTVIHTAALVTFNPRLRDKMMQVNIGGTRHVVDACLALKIPNLIHISSVAALGRKSGVPRIDENTHWVDSNLNTDYAISKRLAELEVWRGAEEGLAVNVINPSVILAPADWEKSSARLFQYVWQEKKFYTDTHINYVDVRDVVAVIWKLLEHKISHQQFIVNAGSASVKNLFDLMALNFKRKAPSIKVSTGWVKWLAWADELRSRITGSEPMITRQSARVTKENFFFANDKVKHELGISFSTAEETIAWCCQQYLYAYNTNNQDLQG